MKLNTLKTPEINQNGYHKNSLTKERIGTLFIYPIDFTPEDCLSCEGYCLLIEDYKDLYKVIGTKFNRSNDAAGTFRIPDYNITGRFLQPGNGAGTLIEAGLPNHRHDIGHDNYAGSKYGTRATSINSKMCGYGQAAVNGLSGYTSYASDSNVLYGKYSTVQPPSQLVHICIKYK